MAGPLHLIEEITNFGPEKKARLSAAINELPADYVVLDMKAGLDANVVDFLPWSNSGILVFTPHLPSATLAASDIVKAILFRKLRIVFSPSSPFYEQVKDPRTTTLLVNELLDEVEDVYEDGLPNLDAFLVDLAAALGPHPVLDQVARTVEYFRVHYVLNSFNGVDGGVRHRGQALRREPRQHRLRADDADEPRLDREVGRDPPRQLPETSHPPRPARRPRRPAPDPRRDRRSTPSSARRPASPPSRGSRSRSSRFRPDPTRRAPSRASWTP